MDALENLLAPENCALVLIDHQAGLAFGPNGNSENPSRSILPSARTARRLSLILVLAAGVSAAHADDPTIDESAAHWHSTATRAQVVQAWSASRTDPVARFWLLSFNPLKYFHSTMSRDEMRCQVLQPSTAADVAKLSSESYGGRAYGKPRTSYAAPRPAETCSA